MRTRDLLLARVENNEIAHQVEQPYLVAELRQRPVEQRPGGGVAPASTGIWSFHATKKLLRRADGAIAQALRIAARQHQLHRAGKTLC